MLFSTRCGCCCRSPSLSEDALSPHAPKTVDTKSSSSEWAVEYRSVFARGVTCCKSISNEGGLIDSGYAWPFYVMQAVMEVFEITANLMRLLANNWFYPPAQVFVFVVFGLNIVWAGIAGKEACDKLSIKVCEASALGQTVKVSLRSDAPRRLVESLATILASLIYMGSSSLILYAAKQHEDVTPLTPQSPWYSMLSVALSTVGAFLAWPLFITASRDAYKNISAYRQLEKKAAGLLEKINIGGDFKSQTAKAFLNLVKIEQRPKETIVRFVNLAGWVVNIGVYVFWVCLNYVNLIQPGKADLDSDLNDYWAYNWINALSRPSLFLFFINASIAITNGLIKLIWDRKRSFQHKAAQDAFFRTDSTGPTSIQGGFLETDSLLTGASSTFSRFLETDKEFAIWTLINLLKQEDPSDCNADDPQIDSITQLLRKLGFSSDEINQFKASDDSTQAYHLIAYAIASKLKLIDFI